MVKFYQDQKAVKIVQLVTSWQLILKARLYQYQGQSVRAINLHIFQNLVGDPVTQSKYKNCDRSSFCAGRGILCMDTANIIQDGEKKGTKYKAQFFWVSAHFLVLPNDLCSAYRHILIYMPAHIRRSHFFLFLVHLSFHKSKFGACAVQVWTEMVIRAPLDHQYHHYQFNFASTSRPFIV